MKNCTNKDYTIKKIEIERDFADDVFKKYRYKRYGIGNCCGSDFDDNVNKKALCDYDDNQLITYIDSTITSTTYTPPEDGAEDDPNKPDWVNALCGIDHDEVQIYFYYDATSLGIPETIAAYTAAQAWVDNIKQDNDGADYINCTNIEENSIESYHTTVFGERWLDWATSAMTGSFNNSGSCGGNGTTDLGGGGCVTGTVVNVDPGGPSRNFGINDCGSAADSAFPATVNASSKFWGALQWAQSSGKTMYNGGASGVNGGAFFPTVNTLGTAPAATAKNILVVCFIDESASPTHHQPYTGQQAAGGTALWSAATDNGTVTPCWAADHTEFIAQRNLYLATVEDSSANFYCYPSKPNNPGASHRAFPLHALGAITSGDQSPLDGTLAVAPYNFLILLTEIETSNPYFAQGYGGLDQHGWGVNVDELPFTKEGFDDDLTEYADITDCNDSTCFAFRVVNQDGKPVSCYNIILDGGNIGYTDDYGVLRYCITNASVDTNHTLQLCHCFTTTGDCSSQNITITLTEECPADACPAEPFIACEDPQVDPSGNELSGCLDPLSPNYCPDCTADCAGVVGGSDWSCCDYCADFQLSFSSTDATDMTTDDGTIDLTVSNGTSPYTYAWTGPNGFTATTEDLTGLAGGVYVVVVTDSSNPACTETLTVFIDQPPVYVFGCMDEGTLCDEGMDVAFVIDFSSSMGNAIESVKTGVASIVAQIQGMVGSSDYQLSLSIADEYNPNANPLTPPYFAMTDYTSLPAAQRNIDTTSGIVSPCNGSQSQGSVGGTRDYYRTAMEMFSLNNGATFTTQLNKINVAGSFPLGNAGTHNFPEATDLLVNMVGLQDFTGTWRTGVAKYIIVMTDALPAGNDDCCTNIDTTTLATLATNLLADDIKVIVVGYGTQVQAPVASGIYPWRVFADATGGTWDSGGTYQNPDYSTATNNALSTLCSGSTPQACNYDPLATYDCAGVLGGTDYTCCLYSGCLDASATNYDPTATADCNCIVGGTDYSCCIGCVYGCMDPLANNYDPNATCEDTCTYDWTCTEGTGSNSCENMIDTGIFAGLPEGQLAHIALAANTYQYTNVATLQFEINSSPLADGCPGPNGGSMAYITEFGMNTPSNWNMNAAGYTTWNDFIIDLSALAFPAIDLTTAYSTVEAYMANGYEGNTYAMEIEWEFCICTTGNITTLNLCDTATSTDITTGNPTDTSTPFNWMNLICTSYPTLPAIDIYFCTSHSFTGVGASTCGCGTDSGAGPTGELFFNVQHGYNDGLGTVITPNSAQTWTDFVNDLVYYSVPGVTAGMTYSDLQGLPSKAHLTMTWDKCTCTDAQGCTCIEMTDGSGTHIDQAACEAAVNCCGEILGCTDPNATNYNPLANTDDGSCYYEGCMDPLAANYDPTATIDDGSCIYMWKCEDGSNFYDSCQSKTDTSSWPVTDCDELVQFLINDPANHNFDITTLKYGYTNLTAPANPCPTGNTDEYFYYVDTWCMQDATGQVSNFYCGTTWTGMLTWINTNLPGISIDGNSDWADIIQALAIYNSGSDWRWEIACTQTSCICTGDPCECIIDPAGTYNNSLECQTAADNCCDLPCETCNSSNNGNPGCCDPTATNYDPAATCDDSSCTYGTYGCMDCGYIYEATQAAGWYCNGVTPAVTPGGMNWSAAVTLNDPTGCIYMECTDAIATNYNFDCYGYEFTGGNPLGDPYSGHTFIDDGCCTLPLTGCTDPAACNYDPLANTDDGSCCGSVPADCGCTDPAAYNYDVNAICDDGSCIDILFGCKDPGAFNYNSAANTDDCSCVYVGCTDITATNPTYFNYPNPGLWPACTAYQSPILATIDDGSCAYPMTYVPDLNFQAHLTAIGQVTGWWDITGTTPGGDYCYTSEINNFGTLVLTDKGVADLTGLQDMVSLQYFTADSSNTGMNNTFTSVNPFIDTLGMLTHFRMEGTGGYVYSVPTIDFSNNSLLEWTRINSGILTSLDHTQNPVLTYLWCADNNLTTVDVTQCPLLYHLRVEGNQIASIGDNTAAVDISQNPVIDWIDATQNVLTSIDISVQTVLTMIHASGNNLTSVDTTTNIILSYFNLGDNSIPSFDFSTNPLIAHLNVSSNLITNLLISNLTALTYLDTKSCQLTALNVNSNTALDTLYCQSNQIQELDLNYNVILTQLHCETNNMLCLNIQNGNNLNMLPVVDTNLKFTGNSFNTISVDDPVYCTGAWTSALFIIDAGVTFNTAGSCTAAMTYVPDLNFQAHLTSTGIVSGWWDATGNTPGGDYCYTSEIDFITFLNINDKAIADLTGLQDFIALETLHASNNGVGNDNTFTIVNPHIDTLANLTSININGTYVITSVDLTGSPNLLTATLNNNALTSIDLTGNAVLTYLQCNGNDLTTLDVTNNIDLTDLYCTYNDLTGLDTSLNTVLTFLNCEYNDITSLDLDQNVVLVTLNCKDNQLTACGTDYNIILDYFDCSNNSITTLDVGTNIVLDTLWCNGNNLTSLDVSTNVVLTFIHSGNNVLSNLNTTGAVALESIYCQSNALTSLDVTQNTALEVLSPFNNNIPILDLSQNTNLVTFLGYSMGLECINIANGNNSNMIPNTSNIRFDQNPLSNPITVDDVTYSTTNWTVASGIISTGTTFTIAPCDPPAGYTHIPDANFRTALDTGYTVTWYNSDINSEHVLTSTINIITNLNVTMSAISDLTGIEDFTALNQLQVENNQLTSLDLSNNTALTNITAQSNMLTSIDVTACVLLINLKLFVNDLTSIDLSQNIALEDVRLNSNLFTSIDLSYNVVLTKMDVRLQGVSNDTLTTLNVANGNNSNVPAGGNFNSQANSNLICVTVDDVAYSTTNWTNIDAQTVFQLTCP